MGRKHQVQIHPVSLRYKTDTETHKAGDIIPYKYKYYVICLHYNCADTIVGSPEYTFSSVAKAEEWKDRHLHSAKYETFWQRVARHLEGLWGELKR